jgi:hypothetical protein
MKDPRGWDIRLGNYQHAMLYTLRRGRSGIRKHYAGWDTYCQLADGNIRYLLQLVTEALQGHIREGYSLTHPVNQVIQTRAAESIGGKVLQQLPSVATEGAKLTKIVLALGRIFQVMAAQPEGHSPEVNQFGLTRNSRDDAVETAVGKILDSAVMHLAIIRLAGDKMASVSGETKDYNYQLHPIFAPFFVYSHRRKRRMTLTSVQLLGLANDPRRTISQILGRSNRHVVEDLPDQLFLFREFYDEST